MLEIQTTQRAIVKKSCPQHKWCVCCRSLNSVENYPTTQHGPRTLTGRAAAGDVSQHALVSDPKRSAARRATIDLQKRKMPPSSACSCFGLQLRTVMLHRYFGRELWARLCWAAGACANRRKGCGMEETQQGASPESGRCVFEGAIPHDLLS